MISKSFSSNWLPALLPVILVGALSALAFPGLASFDNLHIYIQAAAHKGNVWWSLPFEMLWTGMLRAGLYNLGWMYLFCNFFYACGGFFIIYYLESSNKLKLLAGSLLFVCPIFIFIACQLLRDNLAFAALLAGGGLALHFQFRRTKVGKFTIGVLCFSVLLLAAVGRKDAIFAAVPLLFSIAGLELWPKSKLKCLAIFLFVTAIYFKLVFGIYSLSTSLYYTTPSRVDPLQPTMALDLVGMSVKAKDNFYSEKQQKKCKNAIDRAFKEFKKIYRFPQDTWRREKIRFCYVDKNNWIRTILDNPLLYIEHRLDWALLLLGLKKASGVVRPLDTFEIDLKKRVANRNLPKYLRAQSKRPLYPIVESATEMNWIVYTLMKNVRAHRQNFIFKPWFYLPMHLLTWVIALRRRPIILFPVLLSASGLFHCTAMIFLTPSSAPRYLFWFMLSGWIAMIISCATVFSANRTPASEK